MRKVTGIHVLDQSNSPAVLIECGFINNAADMAFIIDKNNQEKIARRILEAIVKYCNTEVENRESLLTQDTIPSGVSKNATSIDTKKGVIFQADTIIYKSPPEKTQTSSENALLIINGEKVNNDILEKKTI